MSSFQDAILKDFEKAEQYRNERFQYGESLISDFDVDQDNDDILYVFLFGQQNSEHHKAIYKLKINLPKNYPNSRPDVQFLQPVPYHPNINYKDGSICLNKYDQWKGKQYYIIDMLEYINFLLYNPNPTSALNFEAAQVLMKDKDMYIKLSQEVAQDSEMVYSSEA